MLSIWEIHPVLVHFPIALLLTGMILDLYAGWYRRTQMLPTATGLLIAGLLSGVVAAGFGLVAYDTIPAHTDESHRWMHWHLGAAVSTLTLFAIGIMGRKLNTPRVPTWTRVLTGLGTVALLYTGYLGGSLVYRFGTGVDPSILAQTVKGGHSHGEGAGKPQEAMSPDVPGSRQPMGAPSPSPAAPQGQSHSSGEAHAH